MVLVSLMLFRHNHESDAHEPDAHEPCPTTAMEMNRKYMGRRYIELFYSNTLPFRSKNVPGSAGV